MRRCSWILATLLCGVGCGGETVVSDGGVDGWVAPPPDTGPRDDGGRWCERRADCDDGVYCNGDEQCVDAVCVAGTPPCDAETQRCSEATLRCETLDCEGDAADQDGDGHRSIACGGDDCNDEDPGIRPSATEVCSPGDGITDSTDEDCNPRTFGFVDIDGDGAPDARCFNVDARTGQRFAGTDCEDNNASIHPLAREVCDGRHDENCNGVVDEDCACAPEGLTRGCEGALGICATGTETCVGTGWTACSISPAAEVCDGSRDENCDGTVDEGCDCVSGTTRPCGLGECAGMQTCTAGSWTACDGGSPSTEYCDGRDSNCNGIGDADDPAVVGVGSACGSSTGTCRPGTNSCSGSMLVCGGAGYVAPTAEVCDHLDNDCNSAIDNGVNAAECTRAIPPSTSGSVPVPNYYCLPSGMSCTGSLATGLAGGEPPRGAFTHWRGDFGRSNVFRATVQLRNTSSSDPYATGGFVTFIIAPTRRIGPETSTTIMYDGMPELDRSEGAVALSLTAGGSTFFWRHGAAGWEPLGVVGAGLPEGCDRPPTAGAAYTLEISQSGNSFTPRVSRTCGSTSRTFSLVGMWDALYGAGSPYPQYYLGVIVDNDGYLAASVSEFYIHRRVSGTDRNNCRGCTDS